MRRSFALRPLSLGPACDTLAARAAKMTRLLRSGQDQPVLLPATSALIADLRAGAPVSPGSAGIASYRVRPELGAPFTRFPVSEADPTLLSFVHRAAAGFEVLQLDCTGFQYHWRSDLAKVLEDRRPLLGRLFVLGDGLDLVVEHLALPEFDRHGLRAIRGWMIFSEDMTPGGRRPDWDRVEIVRRSLRARPVRLPARLCWPDAPRGPLLHAVSAFRYRRPASRGWRTSPR